MARMFVIVAIQAQELEPLQRFVTDHGSIPEVVDVLPPAHPAPFALSSGAGDYGATL